MASGDQLPVAPKHMTYSKSRAPVFGALVDFIETSIAYFKNPDFEPAQQLHPAHNKGSVSSTFLAAICLLLGILCNVKFEVVVFDGTPLANDLHVLLLSRVHKLYIDDIDASKVMWCVETSDCLVVLLSCLLIWNSCNVRSPLSEYLFLPWLGACLRGLFMRQGITVSALLYTLAVVDGRLNPFFLTAFCFLFLLEARVWLEVARLVRARWESRAHAPSAGDKYEVQMLWSNDDVHSVEVRNVIY